MYSVTVYAINCPLAIEKGAQLASQRKRPAIFQFEKKITIDREMQKARKMQGLCFVLLHIIYLWRMDGQLLNAPNLHQDKRLISTIAL